MGSVYLAEDLHLARRVAIKFLTSTDHHYRARFIREARAVSALNHPNIAMVHDYGETDHNQPFIVMEYVKGKSLSDLLEQGLTLRRSVEIVSAIQELAETEGIFTETAGGVTTAVTARLYAHGRIKPDELTVSCITGNGLKTTDCLDGAYEQRAAIRPRLTDFENFVEERNAANPANYQALSLAGEADGR